MPSKWTANQETCFPCKWHRNHLYIASRTGSTYHRYCGHPAHADSAVRVHKDYGRFIGETDIRPQWCPILGDPEAEAEAERDDE